MLLGALQVLAEDDPAAETRGVPIESLILPAVAAVGCLGAIRLVPVGLWLAPALVATGFLVDAASRSRSHHRVADRGRTATTGRPSWSRPCSSRSSAFAGVAALSPAGSPAAGRRRSARRKAPTSRSSRSPTPSIAFLLGYRAAALRVATLRDALWSAATYALAIAIGAAALRAMEIPRLLGPALLTLVFYLWDAFHGAPVPAARLALGLADGAARRARRRRRSRWNLRLG